MTDRSGRRHNINSNQHRPPEEIHGRTSGPVYYLGSDDQWVLGELSVTDQWITFEAGDSSDTVSHPSTNIIAVGALDFFNFFESHCFELTLMQPMSSHSKPRTAGGMRNGNGGAVGITSSVSNLMNSNNGASGALGSTLLSDGSSNTNPTLMSANLRLANNANTAAEGEGLMSYGGDAGYSPTDQFNNGRDHAPPTFISVSAGGTSLPPQQQQQGAGLDVSRAGHPQIAVSPTSGGGAGAHGGQGDGLGLGLPTVASSSLNTGGGGGSLNMPAANGTAPAATFVHVVGNGGVLAAMPTSDAVSQGRGGQSPSAQHHPSHGMGGLSVSAAGRISPVNSMSAVRNGGDGLSVTPSLSPALSFQDAASRERGGGAGMGLSVGFGEIPYASGGNGINTGLPIGSPTSARGEALPIGGGVAGVMMAAGASERIVFKALSMSDLMTWLFAFDLYLDVSALNKCGLQVPSNSIEPSDEYGRLYKAYPAFGSRLGDPSNEIMLIDDAWGKDLLDSAVPPSPQMIGRTR